LLDVVEAPAPVAVPEPELPLTKPVDDEVADVLVVVVMVLPLESVVVAAPPPPDPPPPPEPPEPPGHTEGEEPTGAELPCGHWLRADRRAELWSEYQLSISDS